MTAIESFEKFTKYPLRQFFTAFADFIDIHYNDIVNYYSGNLSSSNSIAFKKLFDLKTEIQNINHHITIHKDAWNSLEMWDLILFIDEIATKLQTIENTPKWIRSSITKNNFVTSIQSKTTLPQFGSVENVARSIAGSSDFDNDWIQLAVDNNLREIDYTSEGGNIIEYQAAVGSFTFNIQSVVAVMNEDEIYGRDFDRKITFEDNDLKVLDPIDTINQAIKILISLKRGDNPQYRDNGLSSNITIGTTASQIQFPIILRQLNQTFSGDDTITNFQLTEIENDKDTYRYHFSVQSRLNQFIQATL